ncbi:hypothetical protein ANTQUA_LOCUS4139 [Anthophora quadrimaculata]
MLWCLEKCLQKSQEGKEREFALINILVTVVVLEERKVEKKLHAKRNVRGKQVVNVKRRKAKVKEDARRMWEVVKAVQIATDPKRNVVGKLEVSKKIKGLRKVPLRLQRARCLCRKKRYRPVNPTVIPEILKLPAEVKVVTKVEHEEVEKLRPIQKVLAHRVPDLVRDQSPEVVPEVAHGHNPDLNHDQCPVHDPDLVLNRNHGVSRDREARLDQGRVRRKVDHVQDRVLDQDQGRERVSHDQGRAVVQEKVADRSQDRDQVLQLVQDQGQGQGQDRLAVLGRRHRVRDQGQGRDREAARNRTSVDRGAKVDRSLNLCRGPGRVRVQGRRVALEVAAPVVQHDLPLQNRENQFQAAMSVPAIRVQTGVEGAKVNKLNVEIKIVRDACEKFTFTVDHIHMRARAREKFTFTVHYIRFVRVEFTYETLTFAIYFLTYVLERPVRI